MEYEKQQYDVLIIGGGITGTALARELSYYNIKIGLLEARKDFARSTTGANSGIIHAGYDAAPGTLMAFLNVKGCEMYPKLCRDLHIPYRRTGSLVLAFEESDIETLRILQKRGEQNGVPGLCILSADEIHAMEPQVSAIAGLYAPTAGVISPYEAAIAFAENAAENGADMYLSHEVLCINRTKNGLFQVSTDHGIFISRIVVNCAGLSAGKMNQLSGAELFSETYRKGEYILCDKNCGNFVKRIIFQPPTNAGKGILVTPTAEGNLLIGPGSDPVRDLETNTTAAGMQEILRKAQKSCPNLPAQSAITAFAGIRVLSGNDFVIRASEMVPGWIYTGGICSPGLTSAPAAAELLRDLIGRQLPLTRKAHPVRSRKGILNFAEMDWEERSKLAAQDAHYAKVICRCETVTEGQIIEAIQTAGLFRYAHPDADWVKRRCRAGLGRCQGGFCRQRVEELIEQYGKTSERNVDGND